VSNVLQSLVLLAAACGVVMLGWRVAHAPDKTHRIFTFGMVPPSRFGVTFFRIVGWCWTCAGIFGIVLYTILTVVRLVRALA
jgi:hypothetical protein